MLDPKEEARFEELKVMCRELKVPSPPQIMIGLQVHDKDGNLTFDDVQRGHSWTRNFWNFMFGTASSAANISGAQTSFGAGYLSGKTTGGTITGTQYYGVQLADNCQGFINTAANANYGILIGTDDTAFNISNYYLGAIIASGNGASQMAYQAQDQTDNVLAYNGGTKVWSNTFARIFNNNSGGSITVKEVGLVCWTGLFFSIISAHALFERSVLSPTVAVANGAQLTVTYEISMDFSSID